MDLKQTFFKSRKMDCRVAGICKKSQVNKKKTTLRMTTEYSIPTELIYILRL